MKNLRSITHKGVTAYFEIDPPTKKEINMLKELVKNISELGYYCSVRGITTDYEGEASIEDIIEDAKVGMFLRDSLVDIVEEIRMDMDMRPISIRSSVGKRIKKFILDLQK